MNCSQCVNWPQDKSRRVTMKTKCLSLSRIQKFKIKLGRWELPNVKVHTNSDIIKQIFTFCEKVFPRHKYIYPNSMKLCRGKKHFMLSQSCYRDLKTHTSLSPIRRGFAPGFVNYKKKFTRLSAASDKVYQLLAHGR